MIFTEVSKEIAHQANAAYAIAYNFDKLPENVQDLLFKLADNKYAARDVASAVANNFYRLPENVQDLLFKLADNKETAELVARVIGENFDKLPENTRNELQKRFAKHGYNIVYIFVLCCLI